MPRASSQPILVIHLWKINYGIIEMEHALRSYKEYLKVKGIVGIVSATQGFFPGSDVRRQEKVKVGASNNRSFRVISND